MKKFNLICRRTVILAAVLLAAGCASGQAEPNRTPVGIPAEGREPAEALAGRYMTAVGEALRTGKFETWRAAAPASGADQVTEEKFDRLREELATRFGTLEKIAFMGELNQNVIHSYLWKLSFVKTPDPGKGEPVHRDLIYQIQVGWLDGRPEIVGWGFRFF